MNGKQYQILGELAREDRNKPLELKSLYVRNDRGEMIQFDNLVRLPRRLHHRSCIAITGLLPPLFLQGSLKVRPSAKALKKWTG